MLLFVYRQSVFVLFYFLAKEISIEFLRCVFVYELGKWNGEEKNVLLLEFQCVCRDMNNGCVMCVIDVLPEHALFVYMS